MEMAICHLTRMSYPYACIAGIDMATHKQVRMVLPMHERIPGRLCSLTNSQFYIGACVDLGQVKPCGCVPEVEDCECDTRRVKLVRQLAKPEFWGLLLSVAKPHLADIFGREMIKTGNTFAVDEGHGCASLGCFHPVGTQTLEIKRYEGEEKAYLHLTDYNDRGLVAVTDWRLFVDAEGYPVNHAMAQLLRDNLNASYDVILSVGLTRPWQGKHWLQVNNVHLRRRGES